jgi:chromosome segregation ATPase|tara:strand:- start:2592 stop:2894 length:303 start_codon:yes stop_codon:yes gene_type:complete
MNFNNKEDRIKYLEDKFDNLMDVIGANYGQPLMEELVSRLNSTIDGFNTEMSNLFKALKDKEKKREEYLSDIDTKNVKKIPKGNKLSEWEEKLKKLEQLK